MEGGEFNPLTKSTNPNKKEVDMFTQIKGKDERGFTLIELLIVVAIIAILAAIAIPQFAAYRTRGYNAAAQSDIRNLRTNQEALFADYQSYGNFVGSGTAGAATAAIWASTANYIATQTAGEELAITPSSNVGLGIQLLAGTTGDFTTYTMHAKHINGDKIYGVETEDPGLWWIVGTVGTALATTNIVAPTTGSTDLSGAGYTQL